MTADQAEAINTLRTNVGAWGVFMGYIEDLLEFERDKCVNTDKEKVQIHQGRARAFDQLTDVEEKADRIYESYKAMRGEKNAK